MGGKKAGGGFLGIGGESGFLNTGLFGTGQKIKGFEMSQALQGYENDMLARQNAIASGQAPSIAQMQLNKGVDQTNKAALALAASQRGASNPMLAFRQAQMAGQDANMQAAQDAAILAEQEKRQAEQMIAGQAASQRGVALNQATSNLNAKMQQQQQNLGALTGLGQAGMKGGMAHGGVVPGEAIVPGDHPANDTVQVMLSPGEVVVPRSAANNEKTLKMFLEKVKLDEKLKKAGC